MSQSVTRLRIDDEAFLVSSLIERCPKVMMLRELVQNALEAAVQAPARARRVDILVREVAGARKLAIRNTGPGMSADELFRMCDLAASLGKEKALDRNFGMGAKVAALPSNRLGMRYRSCTAGRVHEVLIGKRGNVYGRVRRTDPLTARAVDVADVTGTAMADGVALDHDWTEVVLLGDRVEQDTVADPFDGDPESTPNWIAEGLYRRFYRLPDGVDVMLHPGTHPAPGIAAFRPLAARDAAFARVETLTADGGIRLHYRFDPPDPATGGRNGSENGAVQSGESTAAIVFKDEIYDVRAAWMWAQVAPQFGLAFGVQHVCVHVELPDDAAVLPDAYRQFLRHADGEQAQVEVTEHAASVTAHRPAWLLAELRTLGPDTRIAASLRDELSALLRGLGVRRVVRGAWQPSGFSAPATVRLAPGEPPELRLDEEAHEGAPEVILLRDSRHVHDRLLDGRAACYDVPSHELYVNMTYGAFGAMKAALAAELHGQASPAKLRPAIDEAVEDTLVRRIGRTLVHGISKRHAIPAWNRWQLDGAISPEALTVAADDFVWSMADARAHAARALAAAPPDAADAPDAGELPVAVIAPGLAIAQMPNAPAGERLDTPVRRPVYARGLEWGGAP